MAILNSTYRWNTAKHKKQPQLFRIGLRIKHTLGEKYAYFNIFYNGYKRTEQLQQYSTLAIGYAALLTFQYSSFSSDFWTALSA